MDNIGKIYLVIDFYGLENLQKKFTENKIRIFTKCEDGKLQIKIKIQEENKKENNEEIFLNIDKENKETNSNKFFSLFINLFISSSINPKLNATKYILSPNKKDEKENFYDRLAIIFHIKSNIINKNLIYEKFIQKIKIKDCFEIKEINNEINNINIKENYYFKNIKNIICKNCNHNIIDYNDYKYNNDNDKENNNQNEEKEKEFNLNFNFNKLKILENFDYNYKEKLENLSCHESHTDDIVPDIEEKLKSM